MTPRPLSATILVCTYNRAALLRETLESMRAIRSARDWEVVVVDNNSDDDTRHVVEELSTAFPAPLIYCFEPRQGKSLALNTGIAASRGDIVVFTDDDVRVVPQWLEAACQSMDDDASVDYTGGPVRPLWSVSPPRWFDQTRSHLWGTLAILDYGAASFVFEERWRVPLGANMAVRRAMFQQIGGFHPELGRRGRSLLGQEQAEFFARGRAAGARGVYVPAMEVFHHVPASRLTKRYFRRWWYWKGVSRARVDALHHHTELGLDLRDVPHVAAVPRFIWGLLPRSAARWLSAALAGDSYSAMRHQMQCAYVLGYIRACWTRGSADAALAAAPRPETASVSR